MRCESCGAEIDPTGYTKLDFAVHEWVEVRHYRGIYRGSHSEKQLVRFDLLCADCAGQKRAGR